MIVPKRRPALFLPTDVSQYRFRREFGFHSGLLPSHGLRSLNDREQQASFSKWFMVVVLRHGRTHLLSSCPLLGEAMLAWSIEVELHLLVADSIRSTDDQPDCQKGSL